MRSRFAAIAMVLAAAPAVAAAEPAAPTKQVSALDQAAWLAGRWVGTGMNGDVEEIWSPAFGGQMIGHFRYSRNGVPGFYEIMMIDVTDAGLRMRVKHFNPDFTAWEDKAGWVAFEPVSTASGRLVFGGLVLDHGRDAQGETMTATLRMRQKDGTVEQVPFRFRRAD
tara:strand:+ start:498 stop:998 length:501 start_codon:yes stop_codon:yes gene_type:complete